MAVSRITPQAQAAAAAARRNSPAKPAGRTAPKQLTSNDFAAGSQTLGSMSTVASYRVPRNSLIELKNNTPFRMRLFAQLTGEIADTDSNTTFDIDVSAVQPVRSPSPAPTLPATGHPDVRVYLSTDSGATWTQATINAINFDTGVITIAKAASTAYQYEIYVLPGVGTMQIVNKQPAGVDSKTTVIYNDSLAGLHELFQASSDTAPRLKNPSGDNVSLAGNFSLTLQVNSSAAIVWNGRAPHQVYFDATITPLIVGDRAAFNKAVDSGML